MASLTATLTILGSPVVQKNSRRVVGLGKPCPVCKTRPHHRLASNRETEIWRKSAIPQINAQWGRPPISSRARISIKIRAYLAARQRPDVDGVAAAPLDALQAAGVLENDYCVDSLIVERHRDAASPRYEIEIMICENQLEIAGLIP